MRNQWLAGIAACGVLAGIALAAEPEPEPAADLELETILVVGDQPGPGLWKVTRGEHVLWILAKHDPLQARMTWRTQEVEARIAESKEVLYPPGVEVEPSVGVLQILSLLPAIPAALKVGKNPDGKKLRQMVSPAAHAKWLVLRDKYYFRFGKKGGVEDAEESRPSVAIMTLQTWARVKSGLAGGRVDGFVNRTASKLKIPIRRLPTIRRAVKLEKNVRGMLKEASTVPQAEIACFEQDLETLEPNLELEKMRANAWATGDIARLRELHHDNRPTDLCVVKTALALTERGSTNATAARKMLESFMWHEEQGTVQAQRDWLAAVQKALEKNPSTFAVLPVGDLLRAGGYLEKLHALGYTIEDPR